MSALTPLTDPDNFLLVPVEEAAAAEGADEALTAAAQAATGPAPTHTGAMIALIPSDYDLARLAGDEPADQLHLTLAFLGEAAAIDDDTRDRIVEAASGYFKAPVATEATNVMVLNPHTDAYETALALGVKGMDLVGPRENIMSAVRGVYSFEETFKPWLPHVTMAWTDDITRVKEFVPQLGPITFDTIRFAFGDEVRDIPLDQEPLTAAVSRLDPDLRKYWLGPKGSARVGGWGNEGSYTACQREMRKEDVGGRYIDGLCANLYHEATGRHPGRKKDGNSNEHSAELFTASGFNVMNDTPTITEAPEEASRYAEWSGVITLEGIESGDGRMFKLGSLDWAQLPLKLLYQPTNTGGHSGSVLVGQIMGVAREDNKIMAWGIIDLGAKLNGEEVGKEVYRLMSEHYLNGVSVDVDKVNHAAIETVFAEDGITPIRAEYSRGRIRGATLVAFPAFVEASIHLTGDVMTASAVGYFAPDDDTAEVLTAAAHTIVIPDLPPASWFNEPTDVQLSGALTVTDDGRVYGLLAPAETRHRGRGVTVPLYNVDYTRFHKAETIVEGGARVVTGVITMGCGHAPAENFGTFENRIEHYDNTCSVAANVRIGESSDGAVWVAGAVAPFATAEQITKMLSCTLSGDWQPHPDRPGIREFIAALLVPVPGFAMARRAASVRYEEGALTASAVPVLYSEKTAENAAGSKLMLERKMALITAMDTES